MGGRSPRREERDNIENGSSGVQGNVSEGKSTNESWCPFSYLMLSCCSDNTDNKKDEIIDSTPPNKPKLRRSDETTFNDDDGQRPEVTV